MDSQWLQRDFGVYLVNVFDTAIAMARLDYAKRSYSFMVSTFWDKELSKEMQTSNWTCRYALLSSSSVDFVKISIAVVLSLIF